MQVDITTTASGERVGGRTAEHGFKTGNTAGSRRRVGGQVDRDGTAIGAVIERVTAAATGQVAGERITAGELGAIVAVAKIDGFKRTEAEPIDGALIGTGEDQGVASTGGNQAVGVAAARERLEARDNAAGDGRGAATGGGAGAAGNAAEDDRNGRAITGVAESVGSAATKSHCTTHR